MPGCGPRPRTWTPVLVVFAVLLVVRPAFAQDEASPGFWGSLWNSTPAGARPPDSQPTGLWSQTGRGLKSVWTSGQSDIFVPGYIWHLAYKYSDEQLARYNHAAWGLGYGRTLRSQINRPRTLYAIVSADSYSKPQYMLGYSWRARWRPGGGGFSFSGGYTALLIGREDKLHYAPLPMLLPLGAVGFDRFELMGAYVPYFEVGYFFLRLNVGRGGTPPSPGGT